MVCIKNIIVFLFFNIVFFACTKSNTDKNNSVGEIYTSLKDGQAKAIINIDGKEFYPKESIFSTDILADKSFLRASIFDQYKGNIIISLGTPKWHESKPYKLQLSMDKQIEGGLMIGKLIDKEKNIGEGYLMTEGEITFQSFSKDKCIFLIHGKVGKFENQSVPEKWNDMEATIIFKKPNIQLANLTEKEVYF